ncbi:ecto-NOX disulfide-thiol exchanger 2 isoform X2 [Planococcus citri]|uniref:ecto-NOX disulfide-thiol exchanger 2 isoform X2 n=1 Tax=Planococcus citri TaxID=170843 RepID=UPI0031F86EE2
MSSYTFSLNHRMALNPPPPPTGTAAASLAGISSVIRAPPPPPPPTAGQLLAMHHSLMGTGRPILIGHQGFPLAHHHHHHQLFNESVFSPGGVTPSVLSTGLNDAPLEFNSSRIINEQAVIKDRYQNLNFKQISEIKPNIPIVNELIENKSSSEKDSDKSDSVKEIIGVDSDDDDCQVISEIRPTNETVNAQLPNSSTTNTTTTSTTASSQNVPVLTTNAGVWNNVLPNMNFPMLGVNQMLTSNIIDPSLFVGQTFNVFGNVLTQLPNNATPAVSEQNTNAVIKSIIHCKSCTLFPPNPNAPAPTTRDRPLGCKTVFVGGLPENIKEDIIREVFGFCGEITNIRLSNKKFCHIRFSEESAVDQALTLSGYRIRLGSNSDPPNTGRLHVDFAHARDDQYEWECKQRQIQREQRHRERMLRESCREMSPTGPSHFTESEANGVLEKLKGEDTFMKAISVAVCWLDRGECNKRNVNMFYSMIQSINSHVRRLLHDKNQCECDFKKSKDIMKLRAHVILTQFAQIEKLFISSSHKKVWDHFTKAQRKNIELWKKTAMEIKKLSFENDESGNDEMDVSDSDDEESPALKKKKLDSETNSLKDENDSLRCQLEAYKNEICVIRSELQCEINRKTEQIALLQSTLNMVNQEMENIKKQSSQEITNNENPEKKSQEADTTVVPTTLNIQTLLEREAKLLGLISIFLHIHPFGAGVDYICSFLQKAMPSLKVTDVEQLLSKFPSVFQQELVGIGANMERRWKYAGFCSDNDAFVG